MDSKAIVRNMVNSAKMEGKNAYVLVENHDDIAFWNNALVKKVPNLLGKYAPMAGKDTILKDYGTETNKEFIICIDADNVQFYNTKYSNFVVNRPAFLYHTYTHSRENFLAHSNSINNWLMNNIGNTIPFLDTTLNSISEKLYDIWFIYLLYLEDRFNREGFKQFLEKEGISLSRDELKRILTVRPDLESLTTMEGLQKLDFKKLTSKIDEFCRKIYTLIYNTEFSKRIETFKTSIKFETNEFVFYMRGHTIEETILIPLKEKIVLLLIDEKNKEIDNDTMGNKDDRKRQLNKSKSKSLDYDFCFHNEDNCKFLRLILDDIEADFHN